MKMQKSRENQRSSHKKISSVLPVQVCKSVCYSFSQNTSSAQVILRHRSLVDATPRSWTGISSALAVSLQATRHSRTGYLLESPARNRHIVCADFHDKDLSIVTSE